MGEGLGEREGVGGLRGEGEKKVGHGGIGLGVGKNCVDRIEGGRGSKKEAKRASNKQSRNDVPKAHEIV